MTNLEKTYEQLLNLTNEELEVEARKTNQYYNTILIILGGNIAEQALLEDIAEKDNKNE